MAIAFRPVTTSAEESAMATRLQQALVQHCSDCHSADLQEGSVRLDNFASVGSARKESLLNRIEEQVFLGQMPPRDAGDFSVEQQRDLLSRIQSNFAELGTISLFREKIKSPGYGNYINHDRLFSGEIKAKAFSAPRLWRTSPYVFDLSLIHI